MMSYKEKLRQDADALGITINTEEEFEMFVATQSMEREKRIQAMKDEFERQSKMMNEFINLRDRVIRFSRKQNKGFSLGSYKYKSK